MPRPRTQPATESIPDPRIDDVVPAAALPLGEVELTGAHLGPLHFGPPAVLVDGTPAHVLMSRPTRLIFRVPECRPPVRLAVQSEGGQGARQSTPPRPAAVRRLVQHRRCADREWTRLRVVCGVGAWRSKTRAATTMLLPKHTAQRPHRRR